MIITYAIKQLNKGVDICGTQLPILLFADDIVLLANSKQDLQSMLDKLSEMVGKWRMKVNREKSKVVVFDGSSKTDFSELQFVLSGQTIEVTNCYG